MFSCLKFRELGNVSTYSGVIGEEGTVMLPRDRGGVECPDMYPCIIAGGLLVGPAMGFVGALVRASVTIRDRPSHPLVDNRSVLVSQACSFLTMYSAYGTCATPRLRS